MRATMQQRNAASTTSSCGRIDKLALQVFRFAAALALAVAALSSTPNGADATQDHHHYYHHSNSNQQLPQLQAFRTPQQHNSNIQQQQLHQHNANNNDLILSSSAHQTSLVKELASPASGKITNLDVICGKNFMTVRAEFSSPFYGSVFSKGTYGQENCIYIKQNSGFSHATFNVYYDQCGTKPDLQRKFYENTIVIQYGNDIIEAYDEAKRLRCEWFEAYEKPATFKPAIPVADLDVVEMNFQGDDIDCWMEIQDGNGPWSNEVSKIVPIGQPMTIVVAINDYNGQFDMRVKSCMAHDGVQQPIALTDEFGCVLRPKMLTPFKKFKNPGPQTRATVISYARFLAFKFPDSMTVQIQCTVEVCRHGCADTCQRVPSSSITNLRPEQVSVRSKWPPQEPPKRLAPPVAEPPTRTRDDDMSISDSNRLSLNIEPPLAPSSASPPMPSSSTTRGVPGVGASRIRRPPSEKQLPAEQLHHVPQYIIPNVVNARRPLIGHSNNRQNPLPRVTLPASTTTTTTVLPPATFAVTTLAPTTINSDEVGSGERRPSDNDKEHQSQTLSRDDSQPAAVSSTPSSPLSDDISDSKPDSSKQLADVDESSKQTESSKRLSETSSLSSSSSNKDSSSTPSLAATSQQDSNSASENASPSHEFTPTVGDQIAAESGAAASFANAADDSTLSKPSPQSDDLYNAQEESKSQSQSKPSLKPVEVEVPLSDDKSSVVRALASGHLVAASSPHSFNSVRLPSFSSENSNIDQFLAASGNSASPFRHQSARGPTVFADSMNPRDFNHQVNKRDQSVSSEESDDSLLGDSRTQFGVRWPSQTQAAAAAAAAVPPPESDTNSPSSVQSSASVDAQSSPSDVSPSTSLDDGASKVLMDRSDDASQIVETSFSNPSASKDSSLHPVVGTDELLSNTNDQSKIQDRIGSPEKSDPLEAVASSLVVTQQASAPSDKKQQVDERLDLTNLFPAVHAKLSEELSKQQHLKLSNGQSTSASLPQQQVSNVAQQLPLHSQAAPARDSNQPFPNIIGQSKIMPDPAANRNQHSQSSISGGVNQMAASNANSVSVHPSATASINPPLQHPQQHISQQQNLMNNLNAFGSIQQLHQQLAMMQQKQAQQQQQKQQLQTTVKPKNRFSLMSPHSGLQAVASRLLPGNKRQAQQAQPQIPQVLQQQQLLFPQQMQQMQQQQPQQPQQQLDNSSAASMALSLYQQAMQQQQLAQPQQEQRIGSKLLSKLNPKILLGK